MSPAGEGAPADDDRVGFVGLGRMGVPMVTHLAAAGFDLTVHNRSRPRAEALADTIGARVAATPREVAARCRRVVVMVADGDALNAVVEGDQGLAAGFGDQPDAASDRRPVVIDMGTSGLEATRRARASLEVAGADLVEAPVSGSVATAEAKGLLVMGGGPPQAIEAARPLLEAVAGSIMVVGGPGTGATMKLAVNAVLFAINQSIAESLVLAERAGIDRSVAYDVFASSAVAAPVVNYRRAVFEAPGTTPVTFSVDLAAKDLDLILDLATRLQASMPQTAVNRQIMAEAAQAGLGAADMGEVAVHLRDGRRSSSQT